jgi:hypothetical protein
MESNPYLFMFIIFIVVNILALVGFIGNRHNRIAKQ